MSDEEKEHRFGLTDKDDEDAEGQQFIGVFAVVARAAGLPFEILAKGIKAALKAGTDKDDDDN